MRLLSKTLLFLLGGLLASATLATSPPAMVHDLGWMAGCWSYDDRGAGSLEQWMAPVNGELIGMSRIVSDQKMVAFEFMRIAHGSSGQLEFVASPSGQETARFELSAIGQDEVIFENPDHDFPQRIIYRLIDSEHLLGRIEGEIDGDEKHVDFPMTKTSCGKP